MERLYTIYATMRDERGYKDSDVSKHTGICQATLSHWKHGESIPKVNKLILIAKLFGVSMDELLGIAKS